MTAKDARKIAKNAIKAEKLLRSALSIVEEENRNYIHDDTTRFYAANAELQIAHRKVIFAADAAIEYANYEQAEEYANMRG